MYEATVSEILHYFKSCCQIPNELVSDSQIWYELSDIQILRQLLYTRRVTIRGISYQPVADLKSVRSLEKPFGSFGPSFSARSENLKFGFKLK